MENLNMTADHHAVEMLLPWYVNGKLETQEVEHVDRHLEHCKQCRQLLAEERLLKGEIAALPITIPHFTMPLIEAGSRRSAAMQGWTATRSTVKGWTARPMRSMAFAAAQAAMLLVVFQLAQPSVEPIAEFRTLSSKEKITTANAIIIFKPETREVEFRRLLVDAGASVVGGPTEANSYLLRIDPLNRNEALTVLRNRSQVILAQPLDQE